MYINHSIVQGSFRWVIDTNQIRKANLSRSNGNYLTIFSEEKKLPKSVGTMMRTTVL